MTEQELNKIENRIYELQNLCILSYNKEDYKSLLKYSKEIKQLHKKLKKAEKEAKKNENRTH